MVKVNSDAKHLDDIIEVYVKNAFDYEPPVILCVGSDKATGDCLAPLVGTLLTKELNIATFVYGTLDKPVHAGNASQIYSQIKQLHPHQKILCIDACLGELSDIGFFKFTTHGLFAGSAAQKNLGQFGDHSILAVVDEKTSNKYTVFGTRLKQVYKMSKALAGALKFAIG